MGLPACDSLRDGRGEVQCLWGSGSASMGWRPYPLNGIVASSQREALQTRNYSQRATVGQATWMSQTKAHWDLLQSHLGHGTSCLASRLPSLENGGHPPRKAVRKDRVSRCTSNSWLKCPAHSRRSPNTPLWVSLVFLQDLWRHS